jgi:hypothetical protein
MVEKVDDQDNNYAGNNHFLNNLISGHSISLSEKILKIFVTDSFANTERTRNEIVSYYKKRFPLTFIDHDVTEGRLIYYEKEGFYYLYEIIKKDELKYIENAKKDELKYIENVKRLELAKGEEREKIVKEIVDHVGFKI